MSSLNLEKLDGEFAICRLPSDSVYPIPRSSAFFQAIQTGEEISVVCPAHEIPLDATHSTPGYHVFKVAGPLDHSLIGISASIANPLAAAKVPIFLISTWDTDYFCIAGKDLATAKAALLSAGHKLGTEES